MMIDLKTAINDAVQQLQPSPTARLDAEILLAHILQKPRSFLRAFTETSLSASQYRLFSALLARRLQGEPLAYIVGEQEFFSLPFKVTPKVLIPRADTELLVERALMLFPAEQVINVCDLGTGSGAIVLALAQQRPHWQFIATDNSRAALQIARENAKRLNIKNVTFITSDWLQALSQQKFNMIVSNPPYIDPNDPELAENVLRYEPAKALLAGDAGLADLKIIALQAQDALLSNGWLLLEHGYRQGDAMVAYLKSLGYRQVENLQDLSGLPRVTYGCKI